ncbi:MAG TPA: S16 family serine protease [Nitrospira sp.]|nr:S16 family serine protease [Nitrospira sp.]
MTPGCSDSSQRRLPSLTAVLILSIGLTLFELLVVGSAALPADAAVRREEIIPVLAVTTTQDNPGVMLHLVVSVETRSDEAGLQIVFQEHPGRFSSMAQQSIERAIYHVAQTLALDPDSWTVTLAVPYRGILVDGDSLSAIVGLTVAALVQGDPVESDIVMTGTITAQGRIGTVSGITSKVSVATEARMRAVLVPNESVVDRQRDLVVNSVTQVIPVDSVQEAYKALTGRLSSPAVPVQ